MWYQAGPRSRCKKTDIIHPQTGEVTFQVILFLVKFGVDKWGMRFAKKSLKGVTPIHNIQDLSDFSFFWKTTE